MTRQAEGVQPAGGAEDASAARAAEIRRTARTAGLLYLAMSLLAIVGYFFLHRLFFVAGDPAATARSILERAPLYRISMLVDLATQVLFILVVLSLYRLFDGVDRHQARAMVALVGTGIAAGFAGFVLNTAPLVLLGDPVYTPAFGQPQLEALVYASIRLGARQGVLLTMLWGLWLFPFAALTFKCGFLPRFLGVLLVLSGAAYVTTSVVGIALPQYAGAVRPFAFPFYFGEFVVVLWLAIVGARPRVKSA